MAWLDANTFENYFDSRLIAQLSVDADSPGDPVIPDTAVITVHLDRAKRHIEAMVRAGRRYTPPFSDSEIQEPLQWLQAVLAISSLHLRRQYELSDTIRGMVEQANETLQEIRLGAVIPGLLDEADANVKLQVSTHIDTQQQRINRNTLADNSGFFSNTAREQS